MIEAPIKFWSFSSVKYFEQCPYRVYLQRVERQPRPNYEAEPSHPLTRGSRVHKEAEMFVKGEGPFTRDLQKQRERLDELALAYKEGRVECEQSWWIDRNWTPVNYNDPNKWNVVICDAFEHVGETHGCASDYKTGKSFGNEIKHGEQMQLQAVTAFMRYTNLLTCDIELLYLDEAQTKRKSFDRTQIAPLVERWTKRGERLTSAIVFPAKPTKSTCRYCDYSPNNGGTGACPYGVEI